MHTTINIIGVVVSILIASFLPHYLMRHEARKDFNKYAEIAANHALEVMLQEINPDKNAPKARNNRGF